MSTELSKAYEPKLVEEKWYQRWLDGEYFHADETSDKPPFVIVIPPPNVTGSLHMGHALYTLQDIMIRHRRMNGFEALWLPGTDHAGIATQTVVERQLKAEGTDRHELGREEFTRRVWEWKEKSGGRISLQLQRLGMSLDWSRERFTMDEGLSRAVREVFVRLFEEGLIYQDDRLVNWDPITQTVLSDLEVESEEEDGMLWHIAYPVAGTDTKLVVATTRPETLLGDTGVAIHPDDPRYAHLHGKMVQLPLTDRQIPIICDPVAVDMTFGSGAVKITPAHDFNDFETGRRNGLESIQVLDLNACINDEAPERFVGLDRYEARKRILAELKEAGLLVKEEHYRFSPGRSQRSGVVVEPLSVGKQWYVKMKPLAEPALEAVADGRIRFMPSNWEKTYNNWLENIRDWCISRQLWWGHRIPAWTCGDCGHLAVLREDPEVCPSCGSTHLTQDADVLDTWFSSALWPFSTLGWPDETPDLAKFYPTQVMETGFDIIFFWVARMIMMGMHFMDGQVPFDTVYLHAMVRDKNNQKMSKTKGNVIDPLHLIDGVRPEDIPPEEQATYAMLLQDFPEGLPPQGADALRYTLATYASAGRDIKLDVRRVEGYRAFMNKVWNATRFALMNLEEWTPTPLDETTVLSPADRWLLTRLTRTVEAASSALDEFRISDAAQVLYEFVWHQLCDWYLELIKPAMYGDDAQARNSAQIVLAHALDVVMRLMHPIAPHITEELWEALPRANRSTDEPVLCVAAWPKVNEAWRFDDETRAMDAVIAIISGIRRVRGESNIPPSKPLPLVMILSDDAELRTLLTSVEGYVKSLARCESLEVVPTDAPRPAPAATTVESGVELVIPLEGLIDMEAERTRMEKELAQLNADIAHFEKKLGNPRFVEKAPPEVIAKDTAKMEASKEARDKVQQALDKLD